MAESLGKIGNESRRHRVAEAIRDAIYTGQLSPGDRLVEVNLAKQLGTSRAPIREAFRQLELEGLVVSYPYRGTEVLAASQEEIEQVLVPIRITIESFAFKKAIPRLTESDYLKLDRLVLDMESAASAGDASSLAEADVRFHELIVEVSGQQHCLQIWRTIQPRVRSYFQRDAPHREHAHSVAGQHRDLIAALKAGDTERVVAAVREHISTYLPGN